MKDDVGPPGTSRRVDEVPRLPQGVTESQATPWAQPQSPATSWQPHYGEGRDVGYGDVLDEIDVSVAIGGFSACESTRATQARDAGLLQSVAFVGAAGMVPAWWW